MALAWRRRPIGAPRAESLKQVRGIPAGWLGGALAPRARKSLRPVRAAGGLAREHICGFLSATWRAIKTRITSAGGARTQSGGPARARRAPETIARLAPGARRPRAHWRLAAQPNLGRPSRKAARPRRSGNQSIGPADDGSQPRSAEVILRQTGAQQHNTSHNIIMILCCVCCARVCYCTMSSESVMWRLERLNLAPRGAPSELHWGARAPFIAWRAPA